MFLIQVSYYFETHYIYIKGFVPNNILLFLNILQSKVSIFIAQAITVSGLIKIPPKSKL